MNCNSCKYVCTCCDCVQSIRCSGCENQYDEFKIRDDFKFCPLTGKSIVNTTIINKEN